MAQSNADRFEELFKEHFPDDPELIKGMSIVAAKMRDDLVKANRRAMTIRKELALPAGTVVISPDTGTWGVIGKDGLIDPSSVKLLNPHEADAVGGIFYIPSKRPYGSDGSGQSLMGKSGRPGLAAAVVNAQRSAFGVGSLRGAIQQAQEGARGGTVLS